MRRLANAGAKDAVVRRQKNALHLDHWSISRVLGERYPPRRAVVIEQTPDG
jgi:hypothetical protein